MDLSLAPNEIIDALEPEMQRCICCGNHMPTASVKDYFIINNPKNEFYKDAVCAKCAHNFTCWRVTDVKE